MVADDLGHDMKEPERVYLENWHPFFALWPRRAGWLKTIERRGRWFGAHDSCWWEWEYRPKPPAEGTEK